MVERHSTIMINSLRGSNWLSANQSSQCSQAHNLPIITNLSADRLPATTETNNNV